MTAQAIMRRATGHGDWCKPHRLPCEQVNNTRVDRRRADRRASDQRGHAYNQQAAQIFVAHLRSAAPIRSLPLLE